MELLPHPSEGNFRLPARLNPQLREWAEGHYDVSKRYNKLVDLLPKCAGDERLFQSLLSYFYNLRELLPQVSSPRDEEERTRRIINTIGGFSSHDIANLSPYRGQGKANMFLEKPSLHLNRLANAIQNFRDCTEGVGVFLSPDEVPLKEFDLTEILSQNMRKLKLRNDNLKYDPTTSTSIERHVERQTRRYLNRKHTLEKGIEDKEQSDIFREEMLHRAGTTESVFDCVEFDLHEPSSSMIVEQGNRGTIFLIIYNIIKNGYKLIEKFTDYSGTIEAAQRDIKAGKRSNFDIEELNRMNTENRLFRQEIDRRGGKLKISAEVVDAGDAFVVHIWDNATGFDLNGIKRWIKEMVETKYADFLELCIDPMLPPELRHGLKAWQTNPHMSGIISAHMQEFIKLARFSQHGSSGLGLFGSEVLARKLGGSVLAAEMINGGAFFSIVVPKDATKWIKKPETQTSQYQRTVASRALPVLGKFAA